jgi:hypothetical protein
MTGVGSGAKANITPRIIRKALALNRNRSRNFQNLHDGKGSVRKRLPEKWVESVRVPGV